VSQGGLAQTRRTEYQDMVKSFPAPPGGFQENDELFAHGRLADVFGHGAGAQADVHRLVFR
jgi:hypothetical protein